MRKLLPQSLPAWLLLVLVSGLLAAQIATIVIAAHDISGTDRSFDLFRLGERTIALSRAIYTASPETRKILLAELANPSLSLSMANRPAVESGIPADDELAEMEDILVGKLARNGVSDVRIKEELPEGSEHSPAGAGQPSAPPEERGQVEEALSEAASNLISSGRFVVSVQFTDGQWLNFITPVTPDPRILTSNTIPLYIGVAIAVVLLSLWAIRQLTAPYATLERAVKAVGDDLNRDPLPERGSREVRAAARAINWMQKKLQEQVSEREHLAAALAHDLRTPVTRLRLRYELLKESRLKTMLIADLAEIEAIIRSVVDFASHELSDESEARIDLVSLVESVCDGFPGATLDPASIGSRIVCLGRPVALKRCLTNLIDNAVKYGSKATVSIEETAATIDVIVDDEGPGIPVAEIENVFKPFQRLDASRNRETGGIGLGLAIARGIARAHAGDIRMYPRAERGMRVILSLPRPTALKLDPAPELPEMSNDLA